MCAYSQINVILVSSEHTFPYSLDSLGFNTFDISRLIFAGEVSACVSDLYMYACVCVCMYIHVSVDIEYYLCMQVSPADTYELLTTKWGVKHHLATALIERCGGNLYNIKLVLNSLALYKDLARPLSGEFRTCVEKCLNSVKGDKSATAEMVRMLTELAQTGFCSVKGRTDPIAAKISLYNVGGLVANGSPICGFDSASRSWTSDYGLVPAQQSMRLAIAMELESRGLQYVKKESLMQAFNRIFSFIEWVRKGVGERESG